MANVAQSKLRGLALALGALAALNLFVYGSVIGFSFIDLDDPEYVSANTQVAAGLTWRGISWAFTTATAGNWHPVTMLSHMLDAQIFGLWAGGHHLTNLLLHAANSLLLFALIHRLTGAIGRSLFVAALFAVHPLHVESVAWIAERKDVLSTFFALLTIWQYVSWVRATSSIVGGSGPPTSTSRQVRLVLCFALALLAKPMVVTLPFLLLLLDIWPLGRFEPWPLEWKAWRPRLQEKLVLFLLAFADCVITFNVQEATGAVSSIDRLPLGVRVGHALISYWTYIGQMLWPVRLAAFYPFQADAITWWRAGLAGLTLAGVSVLAIRGARRRRPYAFASWFWYVGLLVPVIGLVHIGNQWTADRYTYLPLVGLFILVAWGVPDAMRRWSQAGVFIVGAAIAVVSACAVVARVQVGTWRDSRSLWEHALSVTADNYFAHGALGAVLVNEGRLDDGIAHLNASMRLRQGLATVENDLGKAMARQGRLNEAAAHFAEAVRIDPRFAEAAYNHGLALARLDRLDEAAARFADAIRLRPDLVDAHVSLGAVLARQGRQLEAIRELLEGLRLNPNQPEAHCNLAVLFQQQGNSAQAKSHLEAALVIAPGYPRALRMLDDLARRGR